MLNKQHYVRKEERVKQIIDTAATMQEPTIAKVAKALRISKSTITTHFANNTMLVNTVNSVKAANQAHKGLDSI